METLTKSVPSIANINAGPKVSQKTIERYHRSNGIRRFFNYKEAAIARKELNIEIGKAVIELTNGTTDKKTKGEILYEARKDIKVEIAVARIALIYRKITRYCLESFFEDLTKEVNRIINNKIRDRKSPKSGRDIREFPSQSQRS